MAVIYGDDPTESNLHYSVIEGVHYRSFMRINGKYIKPQIDGETRRPKRQQQSREVLRAPLYYDSLKHRTGAATLYCKSTSDPTYSFHHE